MFSCTNAPEGVSNKGNRYNVDSVLSYLKSVENKSTLKQAIDSCARVISKITSDTNLAEFYQNAGMLSYSKSDYSNAQIYFSKAHDIYNSLNLPLKAAQMHANGAVLMELQGEYKDAVLMYLETLELFKKANDSISISKIYTNIAVVYEELGIAEKALDYNLMALNIKESLGNSEEAASNFNNIGVI